MNPDKTAATEQSDWVHTACNIGHKNAEEIADDNCHEERGWS